MTVRVLGTISVTHEGGQKPLAKASKTVLAILVAAGPDGLTDEQVGHEIWGDDLRPGWDQNVRSRIRRLRKALEYDQIRSGNRHYALNLPTDRVDAWSLLDHVHLDLDSLEQARLHSFVADPAFPQPIDSRLVAAAVDDIDAARIELLERLSDTHTDRITPSLLAATATLARTSWNENLIRAAIDLHRTGGHIRSALELTEAAIERLTAELAFAPDILVQLRSVIEQSPTTGTIAALPERVPRWIGPRPDPGHSLSVARPALLASANERLPEGPIVITGDSGSGKTQLAQNLASVRHEAGHHVIWAVAQRDGSAAYTPLLAAVPTWADDLAAEDRAVADYGTDPAIAEARRAATFMQRLDQACPEPPITIVVDDAHWLDSHSMRLVDFLSKSNTEQVELIIVGRNDGDGAAWDRALDGFARSGAAVIQVGPFTHTELVDLVAAIRPSSTSRQRNELAKRLVEHRATLPLIATELIGSVDPETLALTSPERSSAKWADAVWTGAVSTPTRDLAAAAALTGGTWEFGEVLALTDTDPDDLMDAINELEDAGLVVSEARLDQFSFRHALIHDAFASCGDARTQREIHRRAADLAESEGRVHDHARHLLAAGPMVDATALAEALTASAMAHLGEQSWLEAVTSFANADRVGVDLGAGVLGAYSYAIERSGGDPETIRRRGIDAARSEGDASTMLAIALDGADSGEIIESTGLRMELLDSIPRDELSEADRRRLDLARCRELGIAGHHDDARALHEEMTANGEDVDTWLAVFTSLVGSPPATWPQEPPAAADASDPVSRARMRNALCERALANGKREEFDRELEMLASEPAVQDHPQRQWGLFLLQALQAEVDGEFTRAAEVADVGFGVATHFGLGGAFPARSAQLFARHWLLQTHGELVPLLDAAPPDVRDSLLATTAYAIALLEQDDRRAEALAIVEDVFSQLATKLHAAQTPIAALLCTRTDDLSEDQRNRIRTMLEPHRGAAVIVGAGIAHLGPATRSLASLATSMGQRNELLAAAIGESDAWGLPAWSVRCRLDLHDLTGDEALLAQAEQLATGTELVALLG